MGNEEDELPEEHPDDSLRRPFQNPPFLLSNNANRRTPIIRYNPNHLLKMEKAASPPAVAGYVFPRSGKGQAVRGYFVASSLRYRGRPIAGDVGDFQQTSSKPVWVFKPGNSAPVHAIEGVLKSTKQPVQLVPEHVLLEHPLPDTTDEFVFMPTFCVSRGDLAGLEDFVPNIVVNSVPAFPMKVGPGPDIRVGLTPNLKGLPERLLEERRIQSLCSAEWAKRGEPTSAPEAAGFWPWSLDAPSLAMQLFSTVAGLIIVQRALSRFF